MTLEDFLRRYADDDNEWWRLSPGEHQVFFDELLARADAAEATVRHLAVSTSALLTRAEAAEAEVARLREQVATMSGTPPGHKHDGGHWITCPFCVDDELGMCSACNGTRRIWEMPREDGA